MKKKYTSPLCEEINLNSHYFLLSGSGVSGGDGVVDAVYGGVDEDGDMDPASRDYTGDFDDDIDSDEF